MQGPEQMARHSDSAEQRPAAWAQRDKLHAALEVVSASRHISLLNLLPVISLMARLVRDEQQLLELRDEACCHCGSGRHGTGSDATKRYTTAADPDTTALAATRQGELPVPSWKAELEEREESTSIVVVNSREARIQILTLPSLWDKISGK